MKAEPFLFNKKQKKIKKDHRIQNEVCAGQERAKGAMEGAGSRRTIFAFLLVRAGHGMVRSRGAKACFGDTERKRAMERPL